MIVFAWPGYEAFVPHGTTRGSFVVNRFPNGELSIEVKNKVRNQTCFIIGTAAPPDEQLLTVTLLAHTLRSDGATRVIALLPYLAYARQDQNTHGHSRGFTWLARQFTAAGIEEVISFDVHSPNLAHDQLRIQSISPAPALAAVFKKFDRTNLTIIAPDLGASKRVREFTDAAELPLPIVMSKTRSPEGVTHLELTQKLSERMLIVDDILDTGDTLVSCCKQLRAQGVRQITIAITHGVFTGNHWQKLWEYGVSNIYVSNSIPLPAHLQKDKRVHVYSLVGLAPTNLSA